MSTMTPDPLEATRTPPPGRLTLEEFLHHYGHRHAELVAGVPLLLDIYTEPDVASLRHGRVCYLAARAIGNHIEGLDLGRVMTNDPMVVTVQWPPTVRGPDVCFYTYDRLPAGRVPEGVLAVVPDLVVEVRSPSDLWTDVFAKADEYLAAGTRVVVVLDPATGGASIHRAGAEQQLLAADAELTLPDVLPGFAVPLAKLFE